MGFFPGTILGAVARTAFIGGDKFDLGFAGCIGPNKKQRED
jgi:hypothetical protein